MSSEEHLAPVDGQTLNEKSEIMRRQCISFSAGSEQYAIDIMAVREIKGWTHVTTLPNQPPFVRGVLNLRGAVLPIIDLQSRLGGGLTETTERHVVVIVSVSGRLVGLLVDAVSDILTVSEEQVQPVPETSNKDTAQVFSGFLTSDKQMVAMLDLERLLSGTDVDGSSIDPESSNPPAMKEAS